MGFSLCRSGFWSGFLSPILISPNRKGEGSRLCGTFPFSSLLYIRESQNKRNFPQASLHPAPNEIKHYLQIDGESVPAAAPERSPDDADKAILLRTRTCTNYIRPIHFIKVFAQAGTNKFVLKKPRSPRSPRSLRSPKRAAVDRS